MSTNTSIVLVERLKAAEDQVAQLEAEIKVLRSTLKTQELAQPAPSSLIESITDAFVALDRDCRYIWVNGEAERLTGMPREQLIGKTIWDVFPGAEDTPLAAHCRAALSEQRPVEFENYHPPLDRFFWNKAYPTKEGGLAIYWRDITGQKRSQELLQRQALILSQVHDSVVTTDLGGIIQSWNQGAERITGYQPEEAIGKHFTFLLFEEDRGSIEAHMLEPLRLMGQLQQEVRNRHKNGHEIYVRLSLTMLRDESGQPCGIVGVGSDITEQRQAEKALRENEERFRSLANAMPQIAYTTGPEGKTQFVNEHWLRYSGMTSESCRDFDWMNWIHPNDAAGLMALWLDNVQRGEPFEAEYRLRDKHGSYRWQLGRALPVRDASGAVAYWAGTVTDIHDRKLAEEALARNEERFRLATQAFEGIIYDWDRATNSVEHIGDLQALIAETPKPGDSSPEWWMKRIHPDDRPRVEAELQGMFGSNQNTFEREYRVQHADGDWIYVCDRGYAVRDPDGNLARIVGSSYDVTARKNLELKLKATNERLARQSSVFDMITDAIVAIDGSQRVTYCNRAAERRYGVRQAEVIGQPVSAIVKFRWLKPEDESRFRSDLKSNGMWSGENIHLLNNGVEFFANTSVSVLPAELGGGTVAVIRDVSGPKAAELELARRAAQLTRANRDLLHFAYAVSHDLQTPLRTISSFSQLLALSYRGKLGDKADDFIDWIVGAADRMSTMLRDLVKFARAAGGEIEPNQEVDLEVALSDALKNLRGPIEECQAVVEHDPLPKVRGDAGRFSALFQNLIGNSLKYRKADVPPAIRISTEKTGDAWQISVRDNGIGFEQKFAERIFGVFQRLHRDEYAGTGVGLAICQRIVERAGGQIWAEGNPDQGAVFTFSIPLGEAAGSYAPDVTAGYPEPAPARTDSRLEYHLDELFHILDFAQAIVLRLDRQIAIWTASSERIFGWRAAEALGANADELLGTQYPVPREEIEAALLREGRWSGELKKRRKDGGTVWLASQWLLHRDGAGRPESIVEVYNDITELKSTARDLRLTLERFQAAIEASPVVVFTQGLDLRYTWIHNPALGYSPSEVVGKSDFELFEREDDAARLAAIKRSVVETGVPRREVVEILYRGKLRAYDLSVKPQFENDEIVGVLCTATDVTDGN